MRNTVCLLLFTWLIACQQEPSEEYPESLKLWYDQPAEYFEESLILGNGTFGASVFGGVQQEKIYLNDIRLWSGEPVNPDMNPQAHSYIPKIRAALFNEDYALADSLQRFVQGSFSQSFAPMGTLFLDFDHGDSTEHYHRELTLEDAISKVAYTVDGIDFSREMFVTSPDSVLVIKLRSSGEKKLNFKLRYESLLPITTTVLESKWVIQGYAPYHAEPNYRGEIKDAVRFDPKRGTRFTNAISLKNTDGQLNYHNDHIELTEASEVTILLSSSTSFNGFDKDPALEGLDDLSLALSQLERASKFTSEDLKSRHLAFYQGLFNRLSLDLGETQLEDVPTDERLKRYASGVRDPYLEELYFQFGRYLLISSSQTMAIPANLQGLWNPYMRPPWSSNYTVNINVEENYWLAETANLSELHLPLLSFVKNLAQTGEFTARNFLGVSEGWAACHNSDIWAMSNPVGDFGQGHPVWANWYLGGAWMSTHIWEHYSFTQDLTFLKEYYPVLKGAADFCLNWLVLHEGELLTAPATSPENLYRTDQGYEGATLYGATADLAMIRELFIQTGRAADLLGIDPEFQIKLREALENLRPYQIGGKGELQEWYHDWEDVDPQHRHQTHLFGLYPGHHISTSATPHLAEATKRTLEIKGDESTGWSKGWRINLWARLKDGNHAYTMYRTLLSYVDPSGEDPVFSEGGGTYPNLMDAHPPFQIDGNFGGAAGVLEMLVQSDMNKIELLPALPDAWNEGALQGVRARGGFELQLFWKVGTLSEVKVRSLNGKPCTLIYGDREIQFPTEIGAQYSLDGNLKMLK